VHKISFIPGTVYSAVIGWQTAAQSARNYYSSQYCYESLQSRDWAAAPCGYNDHTTNDKHDDADDDDDDANTEGEYISRSIHNCTVNTNQQ